MSITATIIRECIDDYLVSRFSHDESDDEADCAALVASILGVLDAATAGTGPLLILEDGSIKRLETTAEAETVDQEPYCTIFPINHDGPCSNQQPAYASA